MFDGACMCTCVFMYTVHESLYAEANTSLIIMSFAGVPFNGVY